MKRDEFLKNVNKISDKEQKGNIFNTMILDRDRHRPRHRSTGILSSIELVCLTIYNFVINPGRTAVMCGFFWAQRRIKYLMLDHKEIKKIACNLW
ncbi:MAG: hypothetical protein U5R06_17895 [candidate division KSB1 bacterium]|nr:hypothetical protein [candidate division KSB1 bacterium]